MAYDAATGNVMVFGGFSDPSQGLDDTWAWNGKTWRQLSPANQPSGRWGGDMVYDAASDGLMLFGGETTGDNVTNQTWFFVPVPVP
jgi:hypothetical protein